MRLNRKVKLSANSEILLTIKMPIDFGERTVTFTPETLDEGNIKRCLIFASSVSKIEKDNSIITVLVLLIFLKTISN